ncbi:MAG: hypothetical protein PWP23_1243 [Candidatus Sumerlaeota bacterium]|nr:hypothetical protein [Candidatus Sumerlaeota bacterium]
MGLFQDCQKNLSMAFASYYIEERRELFSLVCGDPANLRVKSPPDSPVASEYGEIQRSLRVAQAAPLGFQKKWIGALSPHRAQTLAYGGGLFGSEKTGSRSSPLGLQAMEVEIEFSGIINGQFNQEALIPRGWPARVPVKQEVALAIEHNAVVEALDGPHAMRMLADNAAGSGLDKDGTQGAKSGRRVGVILFAGMKQNDHKLACLGGTMNIQNKTSRIESVCSRSTRARDRELMLSCRKDNDALPTQHELMLPPGNNIRITGSEVLDSDSLQGIHGGGEPRRTMIHYVVVGETDGL